MGFFNSEKTAGDLVREARAKNWSMQELHDAAQTHVTYIERGGGSSRSREEQTKLKQEVEFIEPEPEPEKIKEKKPSIKPFSKRSSPFYPNYDASEQPSSSPMFASVKEFDRAQETKDEGRQGLFSESLGGLDPDKVNKVWNRLKKDFTMEPEEGEVVFESNIGGLTGGAVNVVRGAGRKVASKAVDVGKRKIPELVNSAIPQLKRSALLIAGAKSAARSALSIAGTAGAARSALLIAGTAGAAYVTKETFIKVRTPQQQEQYKIEYGDIFEEAKLAASEAEKERLSQGIGIPIWNNQKITMDRMIYELNPRLSRGRGEYEAELKKQFEAEGLSPEQTNILVDAAMTERAGMEAGDLVGKVGAATSGEIFGRFGATKAFKNVAGKVVTKDKVNYETTKLMFKPLFKAGMVEQTAETLSEQLVRDDQKVDAKELAIMSVVGGASAGTLGNLPILLRGSAKGDVAKAALYIADPYEITGDVGATAAQQFKKRVLKQDIEEPAIFSPNVKSDLAMFGTTIDGSGRTTTKDPYVDVTGRKSGRGKGSNMPTIPIVPVVQNNNIVETSPQVPTGALIPSIVQDNSIIQSSQETIKDPIPNPDSNILNINPVVNIIDVPNTYYNYTETRSDVGVFNSTNIMNLKSNVPVMTPLLRVPPPLPLMVPSSGGGGRGSSNKRKKYLDEVVLGGNILKSFLGVNAQNKRVSQGKKKRSPARKGNEVDAVIRQLVGF